MMFEIPEIPEMPVIPTPGDFDGIFDRFDAYLDKIESICLVLLGIIIVLGVVYILSKIFGGKKR